MTPKAESSGDAPGSAAAEHGLYSEDAPRHRCRAACAETGKLDGWLLYDFQGSNPIATRLSGLRRRGKLTTRRWYYLVPASGEPRGLVHAIERYNLDGLPGRSGPTRGASKLAAGTHRTAGRAEAGGDGILAEKRHSVRVPRGRRHHRSGRALGVDVVSSGDLIQRFEAVWTDDAYATHSRRPTSCTGSRTGVRPDQGADRSGARRH